MTEPGHVLEPEGCGVVCHAKGPPVAWTRHLSVAARGVPRLVGSRAPASPRRQGNPRLLPEGAGEDGELRVAGLRRSSACRPRSSAKAAGREVSHDLPER